MSRVQRRSAACLVSAVFLVLGPAAASAPPAEQAPEPAAGHGGILRLPDGKAVVATTIARGSLRRTDRATSRGGVVFTDDQILIAPDTQKMYAVDRDTLELAWSVDLRLGGNDGSGACELYPPPEGATAITVFSGLHCGRLDTYDLETGRHLATERVELALGQLAVSGITRVGDITYWVDPDNNIFRIEPDGSSTPAARAVAHGLTEDDDVSGIAGIAGSDVLVAKVDRAFTLDDDPDDLFARDRGFFLGLRADDAGGLTEVWRRPIRKAIGSRATPDTTTFRDRMGGVVLNTVRKGIETPRLTQFDPESGNLLRRRLVLPRNPPGGFPTWYEFDFGDVETKVEGDQVISAASDRNNDRSVVRYDLARHRIAWKWTPRFREDAVTANDAQPLARSADGGTYYAGGSADEEYLLAELDYATGKQLRTWRLPRSVGTKIDSGQMYLDGNHLVVLAPFVTEFERASAVVLEIGKRWWLWWATLSGRRDAGLAPG